METVEKTQTLTKTHVTSIPQQQNTASYFLDLIQYHRHKGCWTHRNIKTD